MINIWYKGNSNAKEKKLKPWQIEEIQAEDIELGYLTYQEKPDYLLETTAKATYDYDAKGNRTKYVTDNEDLQGTRGTGTLSHFCALSYHMLVND